MARPREFDTDEALDKAMTLFWKDGYERASLNNLLEAMEIQRSSFYNSFGDKRQVFIMALKRYMTWVNDDWIVKVLDESEDGLSAIETIFVTYVGVFEKDKQCKGCLMVNTMVELAPHDAEIAALVSDELQKIEDAFYRALTRAREADLIPDRLDLRSTASFLVNNLSGLRVLARQTSDRKSFESVVDIAMSVLKK